MRLFFFCVCFGLVCFVLFAVFVVLIIHYYFSSSTIEQRKNEKDSFLECSHHKTRSKAFRRTRNPFARMGFSAEVNKDPGIASRELCNE